MSAAAEARTGSPARTAPSRTSGPSGPSGPSGTSGPSGPSDVADAGLNTGAVARRLGVSPTTVRSWDRRYGIGPAAREGGRHRRWTPKDIAVLEEMCRLTAAGVPPAEAARAARSQRSAGPVPPEPRPAPPEALPGAPAGPPGASAESAGPGTAVQPAPHEPVPAGDAVPVRRRGAPANPLPVGNARKECSGLSRAAVRLDAPAVEEMLGDLLDRYGLVEAWEEVVMPTLHAVGRKWQSSGDRYVEVEHLLSWHVSSALRRVPAKLPARTDIAPVLLACTPGEQHTLPLEALAAGLAELSLPTLMFGAAVPAEALDAAIQRVGPSAVALWAQSRSTASRALAQHVTGIGWGVKGARTRPSVLLAGPGWSGARITGALRPRSLSEALAMLTPPADAASPRPGRLAPAAPAVSGEPPRGR
ncbi:MerR family transcriptional regulator [Streptomyces sp. GC420]|uniref:MerR family transcriptional regulator n=1 Tax=Streptomyces sp. GC420 TaxID=2697568 RepID=UPI001414EDB0|nr:MerR family transcriptional regulator [Streptomyces sp. GC420]NBM17663.1 MerR family transcriptional regulator [Streptomyces sp. GC420]